MHLLNSDTDSHKVWYQQQFVIKRQIGKEFSRAYRSKMQKPWKANVEADVSKQSFHERTSSKVSRFTLELFLNCKITLPTRFRLEFSHEN